MNIVWLPTAYVVREEVMFSVCLSVHICGGVPTFWMVGGVPTLRSGWWGGYLPSQVRGGGYLPSQVQGGGGTYSQAWMGGVPTFPGPGGGVPTFWVGGGTYPGLDGGVPTYVGTPHQGRYPPT